MTTTPTARHLPTDLGQTWARAARHSLAMSETATYVAHKFADDPELVAAVHCDYLDAVRDAECAYDAMIAAGVAAH